MEKTLIRKRVTSGRLLGLTEFVEFFVRAGDGTAQTGQVPVERWHNVCWGYITSKQREPLCISSTPTLTMDPPSTATPTQEKGPPFRDSDISEPRRPEQSNPEAPKLPGGEDVDSVIVATEEPVPRIKLDPISTQLKDPEIKDFGWNAPPDRVPAPLLNGLSNDDLYTLLRRFNKVCSFLALGCDSLTATCEKQLFHVKTIQTPPTGELDLETSEDEEYSPDKLRATLERLYMTVVGLSSAYHLADLSIPEFRSLVWLPLGNILPDFGHGTNPVEQPVFVQ